MEDSSATPSKKPEKSGSDKSDDQVPSIFATIHFRSPSRPNGWTDDELELANIQINKHIPELYQKLVRQRNERLARTRPG